MCARGGEKARSRSLSFSRSVFTASYKSRVLVVGGGEGGFALGERSFKVFN